MNARPVPTPPPSRAPRLFALYRHEDGKGRSGVGMVAWGVEWPDGRVHIRWWAARSHVHQTEAFDSLADLAHVHGHGIRTRTVFLGQVAAAEQLDTAAVWERRRTYETAAAAGDPVEQFAAALACVEPLPELLRAYDRLAGVYAQAVAERDALRVEADAMQEALDAIADTAA